MNQTQVTICGRLVADPERRQTAKGDVVTMRVVVNEWKKDPAGGFSDTKANFYTVSAWGDLGSEIMDCLHQGNRVVVQGALRVNNYQSDGRNQQRVEVTADHVGPDLRFGTAFYRPRQRGGRTTENAAPAAGSGRPQWVNQHAEESGEAGGEYTGSYDVLGETDQQTDVLETETVDA